MRSHERPLQDHPQLEIRYTRLTEKPETAVVDFRVYNFRRLKDGTYVRGDGFTWVELACAAGLLTAWRSLGLSLDARATLSDGALSIQLVSWVFLVGLFLFIKTRTVLHESMIALPDLGVQLQMTRGLCLALPFLASNNAYRIQLPLSTSSVFIPLEQISTIVIHEGLRRWRVEYYLAFIKRSGAGISVGFPNVRPPVAVLREVYHGLRETLFDEFDDRQDCGPL